MPRAESGGRRAEEDLRRQTRRTAETCTISLAEQRTRQACYVCSVGSAKALHDMHDCGQSRGVAHAVVSAFPGMDLLLPWSSHCDELKLCALRTKRFPQAGRS